MEAVHTKPNPQRKRLISLLTNEPSLFDNLNGVVGAANCFVLCYVHSLFVKGWWPFAMIDRCEMSKRLPKNVNK